MIIALVALVLLAAVWVWLCMGIMKTGIRYVAGAVASQISFVHLVFGLLTGQGLGAFFGAFVPPLILVLSERFAQFHSFLSDVLPMAFAAGGITFVAILAVPRLRLWSVAPALLVFLAVGIVVGENVSQRAMCRAAAHANIPEFRRRTLLWSLYNTPEEFQFDIHAAAEIDGRRLGWSYREMDWYEIPSDAWGEVDAAPFDCGALAASKPDA